MFDGAKYRYVADPQIPALERQAFLDNWQLDWSVERVALKEAGKKQYAWIGKQFVADKVKRPLWRAFRQPYIGLDAFLLQDVYANTPAGRVVDFLVYLTLGTGWKPVLKYASGEGEGDEAAEKKLTEYDEAQGITAKLKQIDAAVDEGGGYTHSFRYKMEGLLKSALVYGRGMAVRKKKGTENPTYLLFPIHPRDIVWNFVDDDWILRSIQTNLSPEPYRLDDILYLEWNPNVPVYNILYYGYSFMQRMIDSARALRRIKGTDMQLIARRRWAASAIIAVQRHEGKTDADTIAGNLEAGRFIVSEEDNPQDAYAVHQIPLDRGTEKAVELATWLTHDIVSLAGIPTTLFYDESSANHNVFDVRIRAFAKQIEEEMRPWAATVLKTWYNRNLADNFPDEVGKYQIDVEFEPIDFSSLAERAQAVKMLNEILPLEVDYIGKILHVDDLASKVDQQEIDRRKDMEKERLEMDKEVAKSKAQGQGPNQPPGGGGKPLNKPKTPTKPSGPKSADAPKPAGRTWRKWFGRGE